ncbi:MAG: hypothetical protein OSA99_12595 [Acidimicrobiales bacterium]|nr:hypothetical protein [Acidimicrobiales bacterium]
MIRKMMMLAAGMLLGFAAFATPALAGGDGYTPTNVTAGVNADNSVTITGDNCPPDSPVSYTVNRGASGSGTQVDSGSGTTDASGSFSLTTAALPNGSFAITVTCGDDSAVLNAVINQGNPRIQASPNPNQSGHLTGQEFTPGADYTYTVTPAGAQGITGSIGQAAQPVDTGSGTIAADGTFERDTAIVGPGRFDVVVTSDGISASTVLVVPAAAAGGNTGGGEQLAETGSDGSVPMARLGVILVATGGVALYAGKKRQGRRAAFVNA